MMKHTITIFNLGISVIAAFAILSGCSGIDRGSSTKEAEDAITGIKAAVTGDVTRCSGHDSEELLFSIPFVTDSGDTLYLNATLSDIPDWDATAENGLTKGAIIGSNNINKLYTKVVASAYNTNGSVYKSVVDPEATPLTDTTMLNLEATWNGTDKMWKFGSAFYWPLDPQTELVFCSYAPAESFGEGTGASVPVWSGTSESYAYGFNYIVPKDPAGKKDAEFQKDLLLAVDTQKKAEATDVTVDFKHVLTAVRFTKGNINNATLEFIQLNNFCNTGDVSLTKDGVTWSNVAGCDTYRQTYDRNLVDVTEHSPFDPTEDQEYTFMVIPQDLSDSSEIAVYIKGNLHPEVLNLKQYVTTPGKEIYDVDGNPVYKWSKYAGKMITFEISAENINHVSVSIDDKVETGTGGYPVKKDIVITNTGRSDIYIRATIVGSWQNESGQNVYPWLEKEPHGTFTGGLLGGSENYWVKGDDGFYYYKYYIPKPASGKQFSVKHPLFESFQLESAPDNGSYPEGGTGDDIIVAQLDLTIMVQAVIANEDKSRKAVKEAWGEAAAALLTDEADN